MRIDLFVALARAARVELGVAFDRLGGTSLCCGHMGQGGSCNSMCTSVKRSKTSGHVKWCVFGIRFDTTFADTMVMCRGLVGASHRIVIRYPIRRRVCTARRTATGACRMAAPGGAQLTP